MAVVKVGEIFKCNVCGNQVVVRKVGAGTLVCCGRDMEKIGEMDEQYCRQLAKEKEIIATGDWKALENDSEV